MGKSVMRTKHPPLPLPDYSMRNLGLRLAEGFVLAVLLGISALRAVVETDIVGDDETSYLARGLGISEGVFPQFTEGAGYSLLYWLGSFLIPDPIDLYFAGRIFVAVVFVLSLWATTRLFTRLEIALVVAALVAIMPSTYVWPGVSGPAIGLVLFAVGLAIRFRGLAPLATASGLLWLAASMRPEFAYAAMFSSALAIFGLTRKLLARPFRRPSLVGVAAVASGAIAIPVALIARFGSPLSDGGRSWVAFGQHFSRRRAQEGEYHWTDWGQIVERYFPGASSVSEAVLSNPLAFVSHVASNAAWAPLALGRSLVGFPGIDGPTVFFSWLAIGALLGAGVVGLWRNRKNIPEVIARFGPAISVRWWRPGWQVAALVFGLSLASVLVIFPRTHYMILWAGAVLLGAGLLVERGVLPATVWHTAFGLLTAIFVSFSVFVSMGVTQEPALRDRPTASALIEIRDSGSDALVLGRTRGLEVFVDSTWMVSSDEPAPGENLENFLSRADIEIVFAEEAGVSSPWTLLEEWPVFQDTPGKWGFEGSREAGIFYRTSSID